MAEEIPDDKFKSQVIQFIEIANQKFDGLAEGLRTTNFKLDHVDHRLGRVEEKVDRIESDLKTLSAQFQDVGVMAIKDNKGVDALERRVDDIETGVH